MRWLDAGCVIARGYIDERFLFSPFLMPGFVSLCVHAGTLYFGVSEYYGIVAISFAKNIKSFILLV